MSHVRGDGPAGRAYVGTSGWAYQSWRGVFYPPGLPQKQQLAYLSEQLDSVEINGSFYSLQRASSYERWADSTPDDFVFAVKGSRFITHMKGLRDADVALANFLASGLLALGHKLGPILWQLPARLGFDYTTLSEFLAHLPRTTAEAAAIAEGHDERVPNAHVVTDADRPMRFAVEVRNPDYLTPRFTDLLARFGVAAVIADSAGSYPMIDEVTADFVYVRLHGHQQLYVSGYTHELIESWATKTRRWAEDGDVFVYFDNDANVMAPRDASALKSRLL
ncbi:DUF72 domain-containing protein [Nocardia alni]|uniref:DUF72 domain-containing protein n=1 Tax=Nocardia alni TaxID=2815723 RepID=UPI001C23A38D|nr:DUF72 domain-containing protein [Nocardia alni]